MLRRTAILLAVAILACNALAQQHHATVQPQYSQPLTNSSPPSGYDPFQFNWYTGRYEYMPTPHDAIAEFGPYHYNSWTGRYDYWPAPAAASSDFSAETVRGDGNASNYIDTRINLQSTGVRPNVVAPGAPGPQRTIVERSTVNIPVPPRPSTAPSTQPAPSNQPPHDAAGVRANLRGHWEYNYAARKWIFVVASD